MSDTQPRLLKMWIDAPLTLHETMIVLKSPECHGTSVLSGKYKDYKAQQMERGKKRVACSESENKKWKLKSNQFQNIQKYF